ncbi:hypothetical protein NEOLEDRAFT_1067310 [Neolentinus lepideus HHB14362 ss-1]|uniref:Membrane anchor Opy2 N-terminal domain-containing protein n=1 Tax=Neolentinus lepideus HHB14362 ss-1 TaxID=1314782 RepID=A0A165S179_9AGAM|nr:hypothetical protein NEOLEDRAFT_1067310 [Neolentinus lepideus HHB14362 ss-1]
MDHVFFPRQTGCPYVADCGDAPACNCGANEQCIQIGRTCTTCPTVQCIPNSSSSGTTHSSGVSKGSLAGAIIGVMLFLAVAAVFFVWYRRRWLRQRVEGKGKKEVKDVPAAAEDVLNRPDPNEKPPSVMQEQSTMRVYSSTSAIVDFDPESQGGRRTSAQSNPFEDRHSIQTMSTGSQATNVIPIAFVPPGSSSNSAASSLSGPARPTRSANLNLNLEHVNISSESVSGRGPSASFNSRRISAMTSATNASYASDFMEAPTIITPTQGAIRQVLGVVKAEVIQAPASLPTTPVSANNLKPQSVASRPSVRSPLATTSFGPSEILKESDNENPANDPFSDQRATGVPQSGQSPSASVTTFGTPSSSDPRTLHFDAAEPRLPWAQSGDFSRPTSVSTQAGTIIAELGSATRVHLGLEERSPNPAEQPATPHTAEAKILHRMTSGRLVTPPSSDKPGAMEEQQLHALAHAEAQAKAQGLETGNNFNRFSDSSAISRASTRADSILESFPFVPPSPISDRPARTPPHSPLAKEAFAKDKNTNPDTSPKRGHGKSRSRGANPPPSSRRTLGMSTVSQASAMSTGLGSFPFQIDSMEQPEHSSASSPAFAGRQRASLDTLALTSDLSSYPLGFDQDRNSFGQSGTSR